MNIESTLKTILSQVLNIPTTSIEPNMKLLGEYAELDSMGIMTLLIELESKLSVNMDDLDISTEMFATFDSLIQTVTSSVNDLEVA